MKSIRIALCALALALVPGLASAQAWPTKTVKIVVPSEAKTGLPGIFGACISAQSLCKCLRANQVTARDSRAKAAGTTKYREILAVSPLPQLARRMLTLIQTPEA